MVTYIRADAVRAVRLVEALPLLVALSTRKGGLEDRGGESKFFYLDWDLSIMRRPLRLLLLLLLVQKLESEVSYA
jgi:hypothetical protein